MTSIRRRPPIPRATILICEDEAPLRELMKVSLGDDYRLFETGDGAEALRLARAHAPDIVILDLMVPGLGGLDVLRALRADPATSRTRVAVVSAWAETATEAVAAGADEFIPKPFEPDDFRDRISRMVPRR